MQEPRTERRSPLRVSNAMAFTPLDARREMLRGVRANETSRAGFGDEKTFATVKEMKLACFRVETSNRTMMDEALESLKEVSGVPFVQPPAAISHIAREEDFTDSQGMKIHPN